MRDKLNKNGKMRLMVLGIGIAIALAIAVMSVVGSQQGELEQLESELIDEGFGWLVNYSVYYPYIEVYENNQSRLIATFPEINEEGLYKIFLTNLSSDENYSQDVSEIPKEVMQKKVRIDEIKKEMKNERKRS